MSLIINGTEIPSTGNIRYNGTDLDKIIYNGVTVWEKQKTENVSSIMLDPRPTITLRGYGTTDVFDTISTGNFPKSGTLNGTIKFTVTKPSISGQIHFEGDFKIGVKTVVPNVALHIHHFTSSDPAPVTTTTQSYSVNNVPVTSGGMVMSGNINSTTSTTLCIDLSGLTITY